MNILLKLPNVLQTIVAEYKLLKQPNYVEALCELILGEDHIGYCSGAEAESQNDGDDIMDMPKEREYVIMTFRNISIYFDDFIGSVFKNNGCTAIYNGESGYCQGFYQHWKIISISEIKQGVKLNIKNNYRLEFFYNELDWLE